MKYIPPVLMILATILMAMHEYPLGIFGALAAIYFRLPEKAAQQSARDDPDTTEALVDDVDEALRIEGWGNVWRFKVTRILRECLDR